MKKKKPSVTDKLIEAYKVQKDPEVIPFTEIATRTIKLIKINKQKGSK